MIMNELGEGLYEAEMLELEAETVEARAILKVYFSKPVGIGECSDLLAEIDKYTEKLTQAENKMESLKRNFGFSYNGVDNTPEAM
jgi:hypothetical protein